MHVVNPFQSPNVLSFCPGLLGIERGLAKVIGRINVTAYVEIESFIIANLLAGMETGVLDSAPIWTDAKTFDARPFRGKIHGFLAGYPCPSESTAGLREGHLYKGFLWPAIRKAITAAKPFWCWFENVDDHLTGTYPIVRRSLQHLGYAVEEGIFSAEEVGAPHERKRLFILALQLGDTKNFHQWHAWFTAHRQIQNRESSIAQKELANTNGHRSGRITTDHSGQGEEIKKTKQREEWNNLFWQWMWSEFRQCNPVVGTNGRTPEELVHTNNRRGEQLNEGKRLVQFINEGSEELADTKGIRIQGDRTEGKQKSDIQIGKTISGCISGRIQWPAGQGPFQYEWEEPRTIEPKLGCAINGYNFREDLLRAYGNSVVEQTATVAFIELLKKHFLNFNR